MDTRLLKHYESELAYMREMGAEFAESYPKIASRLGMDGVEVLDPYVERLLEGSAFLSARVQLELELQYPAFTSHLLEIVYPHFLAPIPSMMVAQLVPDMENGSVADGYVMPRDTKLRSRLAEGSQSACVYRTAADLTLWPIEVTEAEYIDGRGALVAAGVSLGKDARAAIRLRLKRHGGEPIGELGLDKLTLFLGGQGARGWQLHQLLCTQTTGLVARSTDRRADWTLDLNGGIEAKGFSQDEALLPTPRQSFDGYRLLQEYFAMPERFHFVELNGLSSGLARSVDSELDVYILLRDGLPSIEAGITPDAFSLNCVPAINLFEKRCDRVQITTQNVEHHIVADRTSGQDYEVYSLLGVTGISAEGEDDIDFRPFYSADDFSPAGDGHLTYYTQKRKMRQRTEKERLKGARTSYLGSESYLALVDSEQAPYDPEMSQLAVRALVTNRDLPMLLPTGQDDLFHLPDGGPVAKVRTPVNPTRPRPTLAQGDAAWRLISHLSLNYLSIADADAGDGAAALRELVGLYAPKGDRATNMQLEGIVSVTSRPIVRRISDGVLSTAVRGLEITIELDESFFEGTSVYLLGAVLERFFRKYVTINSFTETVMKTQQNGEIARWRPETGLGRII
ncbi:type VI secretion system baseplate subunit TssF [Pseudosulfitobacter sp. SM2401]|jgi:type VI secretion system protein ImpG|uniref:type VI secretion system baseplate subunit TssF n=1 Tax=Pseudosulfitobacter sp. SM2401 TaxID=3350098 RepID=UPI0036F2820D